MRALAAAALIVGALVVVPASAAAAPEPAPDPAPHLRPDPAVAGGAPAPEQEPVLQQQTPAPARQAPLQQSATPTAATPPNKASGGTARASAARKGTARRRDVAGTGRPGQERRTRAVAALTWPMVPSAVLLRRRPAASAPDGDSRAPALVLASLGLLLLVGASASFLHATTRASQPASRIRSA
jgi:hypothetical protein